MGPGADADCLILFWTGRDNRVAGVAYVAKRQIRSTPKSVEIQAGLIIRCR